MLPSQKFKLNPIISTFVCQINLVTGSQLPVDGYSSSLLLVSKTHKKMVHQSLPAFLEGEVIKGFGRGSKDLDCPTANYPLNVVKSLPSNFEPGVYFGWAQVDSGPIYKMVVNIGWCPFYQNKEMSVETHVLHKFEEDFYGSNLRIIIIGYLRGEKNFSSLDELVKAIKQDIEDTKRELDKPEYQPLKSHDFFVHS